MPYNIHDIGPARYHAMQGQQRGDKFRQMMNMLMMMQQMKQRQGQFESRQEMEQERWKTMQPYYEARTQAAMQPQPPKIPTNIQEYQWLVQQGLKEKEARDMAFDVKPEEKPDWLRDAEHLVDLGIHPDIQTAVKEVRRRKAENYTAYQKYRIGRDEKGDFETFLDSAIETIEKKGTVSTEEVDEETGEVSEAGENRIANLQKFLDEVRGVKARVQLGRATQQDMATIMERYSNLSRIEKEGAYWEKKDVPQNIPEFVRSFLEKYPDEDMNFIMTLYNLWTNKKKK